MDKLSREFETSKVGIPLLRHLLQGHVADPLGFIEHCKRTLGTFKKRLAPRFPQDMVDARALYLHCYIKLKKQLGQEPAYEIMRIVFLTDGEIRMNLAFDTAGGRSYEKVIQKAIEYNRASGVSYKIVEQSDDRFEMKMTSCTFWEFCCSLEIPEATRLVCQVDDAFFNSYLPEEVRFSHGVPCSRLVDGSSVCRFVFTRMLGLSPQEPVCPPEEK
ncbi:hypothetical protein ES703_27002 [subsurface metagenome]